MSTSYKKRKSTEDDNKNIQVVNDMAQEQLKKCQENCFFSTYGLLCLLEMLKEGSTGEMLKSFKELIYDQTVMNIAKSDDVFKNTSLIFRADCMVWSNKFMEYLKTNNVLCDSIDLDKLQARVKEINKVLEKMTNDKIKDALNPEDFDRDFVMLLINVLYFKDSWARQFVKGNTIQMLFKNGKNEKIDMMCMYNEDYDYYESRTCQYISIPYENYPYKMVVALTKEGTKSVNLNLDEALQNMKEYKVTKLMLPKFKIEQEKDLEEECRSMGLGKMFLPSNDFDSMFKGSLEKKRISKIKQKTFINVDEDGTEAACVTHAIMTRESFCFKPKLQKVEFIADHPFSFFVTGPNNIVLFAGKFYNY